ncbi:MAG: xylan 1,4-beta-xylosidase [Clostridia bacterium]|nr:xylan 1,4-beta-xylosidase [Clostridia bacterium]MBR2327052.1 xylan 1,4-beta-xylosidase [Clostridia bacterium]
MAKEKRFIKIHEESSFTTGKTVLVDRETGVHYLYVSSGYGGGLTPLLDSDGKPIIKKEYELN